MESSTRAGKAITLLVTSLGSFMVLLDGSIVLTALPTIQNDLQAQLSDLQWTVDAYTLPFAALMLTAGTLGDRLGRKRVFMAGLVLFTIGSAPCGFAGSLSWLIFGRVVQGVGAAAISTGSLSLLVSTFTQPKERAKAIGIWTAVSGVSLAAGPLVGGLLIEASGWPAIFFINLPIGVLALVLGAAKLLEARNPHAHKIDLPGQFLVTGGLVCLVMALIQGEREGWTSGLIIGLFAGAVVLLGAFAVVEARSKEPLLPLDLFRNSAFAVTCFSASLLGFVIVGSMFFMAQFFQAIQGGSALDAGLRLLPLTLGIFFMSPLAARLTGKLGPQRPIIVGALLVTAGFLLLTTISPDSGFGSVWWKLALVGIGIGCMFAPLTVAVMASTPPARAGLGSSMINTFRILGFTAGAAILGTFVLVQFTDKIGARLTERGVPAAQSEALAERLGDAGAYANQAPPPSGLPLSQAELSETLNGAFVDSVHGAFLIAAACMLLTAVLAAVFMGRIKLPKPGQAPAGAPPGQAGQTPSRSDAAGVASSSSALVETGWLADHLGLPGLVVVDCTVTMRPLATGGVELDNGRPAFDRGHIPGAVFADLMVEFSDLAASKPFGLPSAEAFAAAAEKLGISNGDRVVIYDQAHTAWATRFWWLLQTFGFDNAAVLNGGWKKWTLENREVSTEEAAIERGHFVAVPRPELIASKDDVIAATTDSATCLINALSPDQHEGRIPVANGRRGHIQSSVNVPAVALVDPATGAFLPLEQLRARLREVGATAADRVITYCAAGVNATSDAFVLSMLGVPNVRVYDGGLVEWSADPALRLVGESK